jgi:hypothetical protein
VIIINGLALKGEGGEREIDTGSLSIEKKRKRRKIASSLLKSCSEHTQE